MNQAMEDEFDHTHDRLLVSQLTIRRLRTMLEQLLKAYDAGELEMNSPEIGGHDDIPPRPWHEEWLHNARNVLKTA